MGAIVAPGMEPSRQAAKMGWHEYRNLGRHPMTRSGIKGFLFWMIQKFETSVEGDERTVFRGWVLEVQFPMKQSFSSKFKKTNSFAKNHVR